MNKQEINIKESNVTGNYFGKGGVIINRIGNAPVGTETFASLGENILNSLDPEIKKYIELSKAVEYAKENDEEKLSACLKKNSLEFWKDVFSGVAATGIWHFIEKLMH